MKQITKILIIQILFLVAITANAGYKYNPYRRHQLKDLKQVTVKHKKKEFKLWMMDTPSKIQEGMMFLQEPDITDKEGMIFIFDQPRKLSFWMKNTFIKLDVLYLDKNKKVLNIVKGTPLDTRTQLWSKGKAKYAIEMKHGAFRKLGICTGDKLNLPKDIKLSKKKSS